MVIHGIMAKESLKQILCAELTCELLVGMIQSAEGIRKRKWKRQLMPIRKLADVQHKNGVEQFSHQNGIIFDLSRLFIC